MKTRIIWRCDDCPPTFCAADELGRHRRTAHHPLTSAIDDLAARIVAMAVAWQGTPRLRAARRALIWLIHDRAFDK